MASCTLGCGWRRGRLEYRRVRFDYSVAASATQAQSAEPVDRSRSAARCVPKISPSCSQKQDGPMLAWLGLDAAGGASPRLR